MADRIANQKTDSLGASAKGYHSAIRAAMDSILRPFDLGSTQWYVLYQLATDGPTMQRDLGQILRIERATLSVIVRTLVRKGLVDQTPDDVDQRQRLLRLTDAGAELWKELPDPVAVIQAISLEGTDAKEMATAVRVLQAATERLTAYTAGPKS